MGHLLIVGTGRSGTGYVAQLLTLAGLPCTHEGVYHPDSVLGLEPIIWQGDAEASWLAVPALPLRDTTTVLVLRHPLAVVRSRVALGRFADAKPQDDYEEVVHRATPEVFDQPTPAARALDHWIAWNQLAADWATTVMHLERFSLGTITAAAAEAGFPLQQRRVLEAWGKVPRTYNDKADLKRPVTDDDLAVDPAQLAEARQLYESWGGQWTRS